MIKPVVAVVILVAILYIVTMKSEKYRNGRVDHRYAFVDTNPARRVSGFFDNCSPENMEDCSRNNPYEGLPLP
jgi:hypothetical protein